MVAAASYEARAFGVRSAMPSVTALRRCPDLVFVPPRFEVYRAVSQQIRAIFRDYTPLVEPLSLDEAYLDVTENLQGPAVGDRDGGGDPRAHPRRDRASPPRRAFRTTSSSPSSPRTRTSPTASASSRPPLGEAFVAALPIGRFHGVGPKTAEQDEPARHLHRRRPARRAICSFLAAHFGKAGAWYHAIARGEDRRAPVNPNQPRKSSGSETTFAVDLTDTRRRSRRRAAPWPTMCGHWCEKTGGRGRTVTVKARYADFRIVTRSRTLASSVDDRGDAARGRDRAGAQLVPVARRDPVCSASRSPPSIGRKGPRRNWTCCRWRGARAPVP